MAAPAGSGRRDDPDRILAAIDRFLNASRQPVLLEPGELHYPLAPDSFEIRSNPASVTIEVWDERRHLSRRVLGIRAEQPGKLELLVDKFPRRTGRLYLIDLARPPGASAAVREKRHHFREQFRFLLARQFPSWKIVELSSEPNLEFSLSGRYPRAMLAAGQRAMAAIAVPPQEDSPDGALSFGLVWLDYLRRKRRAFAFEALALFFPPGRESATCLRLRWLDASLVQYQVFVYSQQGYVDEADLADYGNLDTRLEPFCDYRKALSARVLKWVDELAAVPETELVAHRDGSASLCVHGLEFARAAGDQLDFGLSRRHLASSSSLGEIRRFAAELARLRLPDPPDPSNALYRLQPESWLGAQLRASLPSIDASLCAGPIYGQVPARAGGDRGVLDLLAVDHSARLAVLELKTSEDIHLPLQALDYWIRVEWHLRRGEFSRYGYFPGLELSPEPPRLFLVAPALDYHPTTETILRFFSPRIPLVRIGLGLEWRRKLQVAFRVEGRGSPCAS